MTVVMEEQTTVCWQQTVVCSSITTENTTQVVIPFKDQESANIASDGNHKAGKLTAAISEIKKGRDKKG